MCSRISVALPGMRHTKGTTKDITIVPISAEYMTDVSGRSMPATWRVKIW